MDPAKYEIQSEFGKHYLAQGRNEGRVEGRADVILDLLTLKFGALEDAVVERVRHASAQELAAWTKRLLVAESIDELLKSG